MISINNNHITISVRSASAIFICCISAIQPAIAVITAPAGEGMKLISPDNQAEQSATTMQPNPRENILLEDSLGRMLYQNHCTNCHESTVHIRAKHKAKSYREIGYWVDQRADWLNLGWTALEKQEVMQYLNQRYYKYPMTQ